MGCRASREQVIEPSPVEDISQLISGFIELALQYEYMDIHLYSNTDYTEVECVICMERAPFRKHHTACDHWFHVACLRPWLEKSNSCPICRRPLF
jgi:hypothetical protein